MTDARRIYRLEAAIYFVCGMAVGFGLGALAVAVT